MIKEQLEKIDSPVKATVTPEAASSAISSDIESKSNASTPRRLRSSSSTSHNLNIQRYILSSSSLKMEQGLTMLCIRRGSVLRAIVKSVGFLNVELPDLDDDELDEKDAEEVCKYHEYVAASRIQLAWRVYTQSDSCQEHLQRFTHQFLSI